MKEESFSICEKNLEEKGFEITKKMGYRNAVEEFDEKEYYHIHIKNYGSFLVDFQKQQIEHYVHEEEIPSKEKINEIIAELKIATKKEMLQKMF